MDEQIQDQVTEKQSEKQKAAKKQVNFRAPEDVNAWLEEQKEKTGKSKEEIILDALNGLILKRAQDAYPSRGAVTAEFESHINTIMRMYVALIDMCENTEERIREEFAKELDRTKELLDEKMAQIKELKVQLVDLAGAAELAKQLQKDLDVVTEQARKDRLEFEERLSDKTRALKEADSRAAMLEIKAEGYDELAIDMDSCSNQLRDAKQEIKDLKKDHKIEMERAARDAEKAQEAAVAAAKAEGETKVSELREQLQDAKIASANALQEAEKNAHEADRASAAEIRKLEQENGSLRAQLAELQAKLPKEG